MSWKDDFFDALFPRDKRLLEIPIELPRTLSQGRVADHWVPDRKKADIKLAESIIIQNMPLHVYKYRSFSERSIDSFKNDTIWITHPCNFNDVLDSVAQEAFDPFSHFDYDGYINQMRSKMLVACFSERNDNHLMWSHYAKDHSGFCIEYNTREIYDDPFIHHDFYPVKYVSKKEASVNDSSWALEYMGLYVTLKKSDEWEYEQEWRIVFSRYRNLQPSCIKLPSPTAVYLGANMKSKNKSRIINIARKKGIPVFESHPNAFTGDIAFYEKRQ